MVSTGSEISYRTTYDNKTLELVNKDIQRLNTSQDFNARTAIVITFNNIKRYRASSIMYKYQIVLATDYNVTYTIINYGRLDSTSLVRPGFYDSQACGIRKFFGEHNNTQHLNKTSNVGIKGKHVFILTNTKLNCTNQGGIKLFMNIIMSLSTKSCFCSFSFFSSCFLHDSKKRFCRNRAFQQYQFVRKLKKNVNSTRL